MKIMYLVYSFTTGGTERLLVDICNQMAAMGHDVTLYIVNELYDKKMLSELNSKVHIQLQHRPVGKKDLIKTSIKIYTYVKKHNISIIHCNSFNSPELVFIAKLLKPNTKIFYTIHGMGQYKKLNKVRKIYRNIICRKIFSISRSVEKDLKKYGANTRKCTTIYNGIDTSRFKMNIKTFDPSKVILGNIARIEPSIKGQDILVDAVRKIKKNYPNIKCLIAGKASDDNNKDYNSLIKFISDNKLEKNITFLGNISDTPSFLSKIDIFVLPSKSEGFGISLVEAWCSGVPTIASNIEGPEELTNSEKVGRLFEKNNSDSLSSVIQSMINDFKKEKEKAISSMTRIRGKYDIRNTCDILINEYIGENER